MSKGGRDYPNGEWSSRTRSSDVIERVIHDVCVANVHNPTHDPHVGPNQPGNKLDQFCTNLARDIVGNVDYPGGYDNNWDKYDGRD